MVVAAAGPIINVIIAVILAQIIRWSALGDSSLHHVLCWAVELNLTLALFNMIPIPPLDGSRVVTGLLSPQIAVAYNQLERYGIILVLILLQVGLLSFIQPIVDVLAGWIGVKL